jgi:hypothetical protein
MTRKLWLAGEYVYVTLSRSERSTHALRSSLHEKKTPRSATGHDNDGRPLTLSEEEARALGLRVLVRHLVQLPGKHRRAAEELAHRTVSWCIHGAKMGTYHSDVGVRVLLSDRGEDAVPVGSAEVGGRAQGGDCILLSTDILDLRRASAKQISTRYLNENAQ